MKRVVALAMLISFAAVPVAHAEERRFTPRVSVTFSTTATPASAPVLAPRVTSKASIERAIAATASTKTTLVRRRNVFKKPWFWVVVGGVAAAIVIVAANGSNGSIY